MENQEVKEPKLIDKKKQYNRTYYEKHRERHLAYVNEKVACDICKCFVTRCGMARHQRTKKCAHIKTLM